MTKKRRAVRMTTLINRRLIDRRAETGFEKIEIAAVIGLLDVFRKHPAIAALEAGRGRLPRGAALGELFRRRGLRAFEAEATAAE